MLGSYSDIDDGSNLILVKKALYHNVRIMTLEVGIKGSITTIFMVLLTLTLKTTWFGSLLRRYENNFEVSHRTDTHLTNPNVFV